MDLICIKQMQCAAKLRVEGPSEGPEWPVRRAMPLEAEAEENYIKGPRVQKRPPNHQEGSSKCGVAVPAIYSPMSYDKKGLY